ncbi:DUF898 family protein [Sulfitobacter sp. F26204]|uniref:DUF898 family protein n=1 Tax=Sulfitobacter sp. F26204 TaxID=2996014 RepID=UPI00225E0C1E|nr:DUF898 family protein [Sulfitobacter sp. F26204]MCX7561913.1 DUF898 family protein [Sulfitobacter sp. F26204]
MSNTSNLNSPWRSKPQPHVVYTGGGLENGMGIEFSGKRGALFWLALKTGFFTILTLGFYRFWMKTRLRRWYWSAIRPGGHPLEYVGEPLEKLLGFFIAVVILTFYIGIVNLMLMFVSFSVFESSVIGYMLSFVGVIPIWFYARYRARRYVLARTRWRGVRFGLEKGAWGYAWRALWYWALTIISLGILWPRMTFLLEKYKIDRTYFGSARLLQGGRWQMLYRATLPFVASLVFLAVAVLWTVLIDPVFPNGIRDGSALFSSIDDLIETGKTPADWVKPERVFLFPLALSGMLFGAIYYRWVSKRIMANHKIGPDVQFASRLSGVRVTFVYVLGNFLAYLVLIAGLVALVLFAAIAFFGGFGLAPEMMGAEALAGLPRWVSLILFAVVYLTLFLMWGVLHNTFVTFPLMRHMAVTTSLPLTAGLELISQRARDEFAEAEGFAEALDLGAAI